jgi:hypothetical protein
MPQHGQLQLSGDSIAIMLFTFLSWMVEQGQKADTSAVGTIHRPLRMSFIGRVERGQGRV